MEKSKFKKLALMGMASGMLLAAPTVANAKDTQLAGGCGASGKGCGGYAPNTSGKGCGAPRPSQRYTADAEMDYRSNQNTATMMSENDLMKSLNNEGKSTYQSLDAQGKALALKLASSNTYTDKNQAVKEAAKKMAERRSMNSSMNSNNQWN